MKKIFGWLKTKLNIRSVRRSTEADKLLKDLFNHVSDPHGKIWPQCIVGKIINGEQVWFEGGVDDEFRDYLVRVKKYINRYCA
jgi:hypothetical protein